MLKSCYDCNIIQAIVRYRWDNRACILNRVCVIIKVVYSGWYHMNHTVNKQALFISIQFFKLYYPLRSVYWTETGGS